MTFKPMLAHNEVMWEHKNLFPTLASPKIDGIRGCIVDGQLISRSGKRFPSQFINDDYSHTVLSGFDGELVSGNPWDKHCIEQSKSAVSTLRGTPQCVFYVFDDFSEPELMFSERLEKLAKRVAEIGHPRIQIVPQWLLYSRAQVEACEEYVLGLGYEGLILKNPESQYYFRRCLASRPYMMKLKRFTDGEARIIGTFEEMENTNEQTRSPLGYAERSTHAAGMVGKNRLGGLIVRVDGSDTDFRIGSGFTAEQREQLWQYRDQLPGQIVKFKHFEHGAKDKPRHPIFLGFRVPEIEG